VTTKERIHLLVNRLDERESEAALILLNRLVSPSRSAMTDANNVDVVAEREIPVHHQLTSDSPLWSIVGLDTSEGPGDVSEHHDKYLAEAYADLSIDDTK
jgi:hypothetical protein